MLGVDTNMCTKGWKRRWKRSLSVDSRVSSYAGTACLCRGDDTHNDQFDDTCHHTDRSPESAAGHSFAGVVQHSCVDTSIYPKKAAAGAATA